MSLLKVLRFVSGCTAYSYLLQLDRQPVSLNISVSFPLEILWLVEAYASNSFVVLHLHKKIVNGHLFQGIFFCQMCAQVNLFSPVRLSCSPIEQPILLSKYSVMHLVVFSLPCRELHLDSS